jgi:cellulose synthase/poly-beta-1,6-N-acetylglucosamine synthase-like glycosyltransferase
MIWEIILWVSIVAIIQSYVLYPLIISILSLFKKDNDRVLTDTDDLPFVSIIMAVHNEEKVISEKSQSLYNTRYPGNRFELLVGSDGSSDSTNDILEEFSKDHDSFHFFPFRERRGKPAVINELREKARGDILIMTDAQLLFTPDTIFELVKHYRNEQIGLVGANILNTRIDKSGISYQEWSFMSREIRLKYHEGKVWGTMIGAYGACYSIRNEYFSRVPEGYSVDDFYITMKVLERKKRCILEMKAIGYENVPNRLSEEFRRKIRIAAGNFQNLKTFYKLLWPPYTGLAYSFFSHKVLRWMGPFFLLLLIVSNIILALSDPFYRILLMIQGGLIISPFIDFLLRKIGLHIVILRFITHFYSMNLALLAGFLKFIKGTETNVWQPTRRS